MVENNPIILPVHFGNTFCKTWFCFVLFSTEIFTDILELNRDFYAFQQCVDLTLPCPDAQDSSVSPTMVSSLVTPQVPSSAHPSAAGAMLPVRRALPAVAAAAGHPPTLVALPTFAGGESCASPPSHLFSSKQAPQ